MPGHLVIVDQFIDRTKVSGFLGVPAIRHSPALHSAPTQTRNVTFYEKGVVAHVGFSEPTFKVLRSLLVQACQDACVTFHGSGSWLSFGVPRRCERRSGVLTASAHPQART